MIEYGHKEQSCCWCLYIRISFFKCFEKVALVVSLPKYLFGFSQWNPNPASCFYLFFIPERIIHKLKYSKLATVCFWISFDEMFLNHFEEETPSIWSVVVQEWADILVRSDLCCHPLICCQRVSTWLRLYTYLSLGVLPLITSIFHKSSAIHRDCFTSMEILTMLN